MNLRRIQYFLLVLFLTISLLPDQYAQTLQFANGIELIDHPDNDPDLQDAFMGWDYNQDGILDLLGYDGSRTLLLTGKGNNEYSQKFFDRFVVLKMMDFDQDGVRDDFVTESTIQIHTDSGNFKQINPDIDFADIIYEAADFDGNGHTDLVTLYNLNNRAEYLDLYLNDGDSVFTKQRLFDEEGVRDIDIGDVEDDGDLDIILTKSSGSKGALLLNDGTGNFTVQMINPGVQTGRGNIDLNDMDNDGDLDVIMYSSQNVVVFENTDTLSSFGSYTEIESLGNKSILHIEDFNNDDLPEIFIRHYNFFTDQLQVTVFVNRGNLRFGSPKVLLNYQSEGGIAPPRPYLENLLSTFDTDFDGDQDIIFTQLYRPTEITLLENLHIDNPTSVDIPRVSAKQVLVFPNPATHQIQLDVPSSLSSSQFEYAIYSSKLHIVQRGVSTGNMKIDVESIPEGVYYITVKENGQGGMYVGEFVKLN